MKKTVDPHPTRDRAGPPVRTVDEMTAQIIFDVLDAGLRIDGQDRAAVDGIATEFRVDNGVNEQIDQSAEDQPDANARLLNSDVDFMEVDEL